MNIENAIDKIVTLIGEQCQKRVNYDWSAMNGFEWREKLKEILSSIDHPAIADAQILANFSRQIIERYCFGVDAPDGGTVQDMAEKAGLIEMHPMTREEWEAGGAEYFDEEEIGKAD